jgi:hypothetical protein
MIVAPDGQAFLMLLKAMWKQKQTLRQYGRVLNIIVQDVMVIKVMFLMTDQNQLACGTVITVWR